MYFPLLQFYWKPDFEINVSFKYIQYSIYGITVQTTKKILTTGVYFFFT